MWSLCFLVFCHVHVWMILLTSAAGGYSYQPSSNAKNNANNPVLKVSPSILVQQGMQAFQQGKIQESIQYFDQADAMVPNHKLTPYLWQRGISLYYNQDYLQASRQFQYDIQVNPNDVEEMVWNMASLYSLLKCQDVHVMDDWNLQNYISTTLSSLPKQVHDRRPIMKVIYSLFRGMDSTTEQDLAMYPYSYEYTKNQTPSSSVSSADEFYSLFYLALYCESFLPKDDDVNVGKNDALLPSSFTTTSKAEYYMRAALQTSYAMTSKDYMVSCAKVHCALRHWL